MRPLQDGSDGLRRHPEPHRAVRKVAVEELLPAVADQGPTETIHYWATISRSDILWTFSVMGFKIVIDYMPPRLEWRCWDGKKVSLYPMIFSIRRSFFGPKNCHGTTCVSFTFLEFTTKALNPHPNHPPARSATLVQEGPRPPKRAILRRTASSPSSGSWTGSYSRRSPSPRRWVF